MANNKMLIDASHPEETRVVVVRGNRIEEFDFEAQDRRQLRGNIYLAKVTRVEPSLQAAFIDYGGNRHGFLAFSEIHPDYYQIPAADRQALLEAEAEAAINDDDDEENGVSIEEAVDSSDTDEDDESPKKKSRRKSRRGGRGRKAHSEDAADESDNDDKDDSDGADDESGSDDASGEESGDVAEASDAESGADGEERPKKRSRRPRRSKAAEQKNDAGSDEDSGDESSSGKTMAAMMEMDTISEDAPDEPSDNDSTDGDSEEPAKKPKRKPAKRKTTAKKADKKAEKEEAPEETASEEAVSEEEEAEKPKRKPRRKAAAKKKDTDASDDTSEAVVEASSEEAGDESDDASDDESESRGKRRRSRNGRRRKAKADASDNDDSDEVDEKSDEAENGENGKPVESVGQEDALEEVAVKRPRRQYKIQEVIRRRQVMLVQVVKEERGNKGAALTTYLSLAGRYSVLMPNTARGGGISRKITNPADRKRLKEIAGSLDVPQGMGVILRTAGAAREREEIERDFDYLMRLWENVRELTLESSAPFLVYEEGSLIKRSIRDLYNKDIGEIIVSGEEGYREAKDFMQMLMPGHGRNVKLYNGEQPLLAKFNVESQLDKMVTPQVTLKSGGYLIINQTEALVAIDVNSGRSTREHSIEATALQTNLEAAEEVARQLRLRDLAGLVVIDFIDMEEKRNNRSVERKLKECLKNDRARIQVGHISHFGLLEMSRQRIRASVLESTMAVCPTCQGVGHIRSEPSFGLHILRGIDDHLNRHSRNDVTVKVPPSIAMYLLNNKRGAVSELEDRYGVKITFESDHTIECQEFTIEKGEPATRTPRKVTAVNPMHMEEADSEDEDAVAETQEASNGDDNNGEGTGEGNGNKRGRRRRGRGRGRNRGNDDQRADDNRDEASASSADADQDADDGDQDEVTHAKSSDDVKEEAKETKAPASRKAEKPAAKASPSTEEDDEASEPATPRRRTGRPGKKVKSEAEKAESKKANGEATAPKTGNAPPREVKRRQTRRVAKPKDEAAAGNSNDGENSEAPSWGGGFLS